MSETVIQNLGFSINMTPCILFRTNFHSKKTTSKFSLADKNMITKLLKMKNVKYLDYRAYSDIP